MSFNKCLPRYQKIIREACEQSGRIKEPTIEFISLKEIDFDKYNNILISDLTGTPFQTVIKDRNSSYILVIGPEGGLSQEETELLKQKGGLIISY